jgi:hypothetical protein
MPPGEERQQGGHDEVLEPEETDHVEDRKDREHREEERMPVWPFVWMSRALCVRPEEEGLT